MIPKPGLGYIVPSAGLHLGVMNVTCIPIAFEREEKSSSISILLD